jgi:hypothetical protein
VDYLGTIGDSSNVTVHQIQIHIILTLDLAQAVQKVVLEASFMGNTTVPTSSCI